jgi:SSS family solute:Na+ symporter
LLGGAFLTMASHGTDQTIVQRLLAARSQRESRRALLASAAIVLVQFALFLVIGAMLYAWHGAPVIQPGVSYDTVFPEFVVTQMPVGLRGLVIAAILAVAMSNASGSLNSMASSSVVDLYRLTGHEADPGRVLRLSRMMTLVWGAALAVLGTVRWGPVLEAGLTIASITFGSLLGLFLLGFYNRRATPNGALCGMFAGLAFILAIKFGTTIVWTWYVLLGTAMTFAVGSLASLFDRAPRARPDESTPTRTG